MARARVKLKKAPVMRTPEWTLCVTLPIRTVSGMNLREHYRVRIARITAERAGARDGLKALLGPCHRELPLGYGYTIHLTRLGGRGLDDDNLGSAFKHVRDGVADWLGYDDGDKLLKWDCFQTPGGASGVEILIKCAPHD